MNDETLSLSESEIDEIVIAQADDDSSWEEPVHVHRNTSGTFPLSSEIAARASFIARMHGATRVEDWLARIIEERLRFEESAFAEIKRDLARKNRRA